jgi:hypothetical protein
MEIRMKNLLLFIQVVLIGFSAGAQTIRLEDHQVRMTCSIHKVNDSIVILNTSIENLLGKTVFMLDQADFYRKLVVGPKVYFYVNAGMYQKTYWSGQAFATLKKVEGLSRMELSDTLLLPSTTHHLLMDMSFDYISEDIVKSNKLKISNNVKQLPEIYFLKMSDYKLYGKYLSSVHVIKIE